MLTILIVDDEKLERNGIKFLLKREKRGIPNIRGCKRKGRAGCPCVQPCGYSFFRCKDALYERIGACLSG